MAEEVHTETTNCVAATACATVVAKTVNKRVADVQDVVEYVRSGSSMPRNALDAHAIN